MDFASGLANLEQTAANAGGGGRRRGGGGGGGDHYRRNNYGGNKRSYQHHNRHQDRRRNQRPRHHDDRYGGGGGHYYDRDRSLDGLLNFGYRLPQYRRPSLMNGNNENRTYHIALLCICIEDLPYEHIWKEWAATAKEGVDDDNNSTELHVSFVCHAKHPEKIQSPWLQQRLLLQPRRIIRGNSYSDPEYLTHHPEWGSVEITRAMIDLLIHATRIGKSSNKTATTQQQQPTPTDDTKDDTKDASSCDGNVAVKEEDDYDARFDPNRFYMDPSDSSSSPLKKDKKLFCPPPVDKFIFISETCLPVTSLKECREALFGKEPQKTVERKGKETEPEPELEPKTEKETKDEAETEENAEAKTEEKPENHNEQPQEKHHPHQQQQKQPSEELSLLHQSWVNARNFNTPGTPKNMYEKDQFNNINRWIPRNRRWKADQWLVLSRVHADAILDIDYHMRRPKDQLWYSFSKISASDEMYFPTALGLVGVLTDQVHNNAANQQQQGQQPQKYDDNYRNDNNNSSLDLIKQPVTYTDWSGGMRNPVCFTNGLSDYKVVARLARKAGCLFARKFAPYLAAFNTGKVTAAANQPEKKREETGEIKTDDWKQELLTIQNEENKSAEQK